MTWSTWVLFGFLLLVVELLVPGGFFVCFFGVGALLAGVLTAFGVAGSPAVQWLLFSAISLVSLALFRKPLLHRIRKGQPTHEVDSLIGAEAIAMSEIEVDNTGKVELHGTSWSAKNIGLATILTGQRCRVEKVNGLVLLIRS